MPWHNAKYEKWVRTLPCCRCEKPGPSRCHHIKGVGRLSGVALKAPSWASMPLCDACHGIVHREPDMWPLQWEWALRTVGLWMEGNR